MAQIKGKEMLYYVYNNCANAKIFDKIVIATPDKEILTYCSKENFDSIITSKKHERASDRCTEVIEKLEQEGESYDIITLVQGDEPLVDSETIKKITLRFEEEREKYCCANGIAAMNAEDFKNPNCIKVLTNTKKEAIYMSRVGIPYNGDDLTNVGKQICIIPFTPESLKKYSKLAPTPLEKVESIDMLRFIEYGYKVKMVDVETHSHPVDVPEDILKVEKIMESEKG
ncbi:3-deoxy-manno-octulosonate cytidylyltransferase [Synechococcus sp. RS9916]|nr:3-deoxy-manno-octulosonate cytidylyltransferase [Synechococcus sp. RS9916]